MAASVPPESRFDLMSDLCILAGQAVMQVGSSELKAAMRVVLTVLGREVAERTFPDRADRPARRAVGNGRSRPGAAPPPSAAEFA